MVQQAVTELVIDGSGAFRVLGQVENAAEDAGRAVDGVSTAGKRMSEAFSTGGVDQFNAAIQRINAAQEKGLAITTQRISRITADQRAMERWQGVVDPAVRLEIKLRREAERAAIDMANAVALGYTTPQRALSVLTALEAKHATQLRESANAARQLDAALAGVNDNRAMGPTGAGSFNTANIAAQFQDIGVTAAMGMNPLQIALQQGTQLSMVFDQMKASGQSVAVGLRTALLSIVSPLSLITIGAIAAGTALVQWFMKSEKEADKVKDKLEDHADAVRMIKDLYGETAAAAERAGNAGGLAFSAASVRNDAAFWQRELQRQAQTVTDQLRGDGILTRGLFGSLTNISDLRAAAGDLTDEVEALIRSAGEGAADFNAFNRSLDAAFETARKSGKDVTAAYNEIERVRDMAQAAFQVGGKFEAFAGPINQLQVDIAANNVDLEKFNSQVERIGKQQGIQEQADQAIALGAELVKIAGYLQQLENARFLKTEQIRDRLASERMDTGQSYYQQRQREWELEDRILDAQTQQVKALTDQEKIAAAGALAKARNPVEGEERRREILVAERQERERLDAAWRQGEIERARGREEDMLQARQQQDLIGKSIGQVAALEFQWQAEAAARQAAAETGRKVGEDELALIRQQAAEVGNLAQQYAQLQFAKDIQFEREQIGRSDIEKRVADEMRRLHGDDYKRFMTSADAAGVRFNERLRETQDELKRISEASKDAFVGLIDLLYQSGDAGEKVIGIFANLGRMFAQMGAAQLFDFATGKTPSLFGPSSAITASSRQPAIAAKQMEEISDSLQGVTTSALTVARQFEGLNERADSKVLDGFMQASGQWKNLSAVDTAWCAAFANAAIAKAGGQGTGSNLASSFLNWGLGTNNPRPGDIVVLKPQSAGSSGHVGFVAGFGDGTVQVFGGNQSNGVNVKSFGMDQVAGFRTDPSLLTQAISDGTVDASKRISSGSSFQDRFDTGGAGGAAGGMSPRMQGALGTLGAGFGAFAGGMQSGDPFSGALGGAFTGLGAAESVGSALGIGAMAAAPIAIIGGAVLGLIGGLIGRAKKKKAELKQAQQELESQLGAISDLMATATGNFLGSFQKQFTSTIDELNKAIQMAEKAKNTALANNLRGAMNTFFEDLSDKWERGFEGMIASLNAGEGLDGAFMKGMGAVENMRESLIGFVNDTRFFTEAGGDLQKAIAIRDGVLGVNDNKKLNQYQASVWINKDQGYRENELIEGYLGLAKQVMARGVEAFSKEGGQLYQTLGELRDAAEAAGVKFDALGDIIEDTTLAVDVEARVREAQEAARNTLYAQLSGAKALTEVEQAFDNLQGKAAAMSPLLEDLGISAETAGRAIAHHLQQGIDNLIVSLTTDLTRSINQLAGADYLNELMDAQTTYEGRLRDLAKVGLDTGMAAQELVLRLRNIAREAELTDDQLTALAKAFPQMDIALLSLRGTMDDMLSVEDAKAKLDEAKADLRAAYDKEASALEQLISRTESFVKSLRKFRDEMRLNDNSPLSQHDQVLEAQKQFRDIAALAATGDEEAMGRLTEVSQNYLDEARAYYASSESYFRIWEEVDRSLASVEDRAGRQLTEDQKQSDLLKQQVSGLIDINDSVMSVADAIAALAGAQSASAAAEARQKAEQDKLYRDTLALLQANGQAYDPAITNLYKNLLGRAPDAAGGAFWTNALNTGTSLAEIERLIKQSTEFASIRGFADGGWHYGGLRIVGERGPEIEATGASRIWSATETQRMLRQSFAAPQQAPSNDNSWAAVLAELKALRAEVAQTREAQSKGTAQLASGLNTQVELMQENNATQAENASTLRRALAG